MFQWHAMQCNFLAGTQCSAMTWQASLHTCVLGRKDAGLESAAWTPAGEQHEAKECRMGCHPHALTHTALLPQNTGRSKALMCGLIQCQLSVSDTRQQCIQSHVSSTCSGKQQESSCQQGTPLQGTACEPTSESQEMPVCQHKGAQARVHPEFGGPAAVKNVCCCLHQPAGGFKILHSPRKPARHEHRTPLRLTAARLQVPGIH